MLAPVSHDQRGRSTQKTSRVGNGESAKTVFTTTSRGRSRSARREIRCWYCNATDHVLYDCSNFTALAVTERWKCVKKEKRCFKCLRAGHDQKSCSFLRCTTDKKNRPHHSLLHQPSLSVRDQKQRNSKSNAPVITIEDKRSK